MFAVGDRVASWV